MHETTLTHVSKETTNEGLKTAYRRDLNFIRGQCGSLSWRVDQAMKDIWPISRGRSGLS